MTATDAFCVLMVMATQRRECTKMISMSFISCITLLDVIDEPTSKVYKAKGGKQLSLYVIDAAILALRSLAKSRCNLF